MVMTRTDERLPTQGQLLLPMLNVLGEAGGEATSTHVHDALADAVQLPPERRNRQVRAGAHGRLVNEWGRHVRWVRQRATLEQLVHTPESGVWALTDRGDTALRNAAHARVVRVFVTEHGVMLWGDEDAVTEVIEDGSLDLFLSSLPYPDQRKPYENQHPEREHIDWVLGMADRLRPKLHDDGSLVLNLGVPFERGRPVESTWLHRLILRMVDELGYVLCQTLYWHNPAKLPSPAEWVCRRRERLVPDVEPVVWFAKHPHPYADNSGVLQPYGAAMRRRVAAGGETATRRPSGHTMAHGAFSANNGGAIPGTLISAPNTDSNSYYFRRCRETGIPPHPARFPRALPERVIGMLTPVGGMVADLLGGSGETAAAAERMRRQWIVSDLSLTYILGSSFHFERTPGYRSDFPSFVVPRAPEQPDLFFRPQR